MAYEKQGFMPLLDHKSVVAKKYSTLLISSATLSLMLLYNDGIAVCKKYFEDGRSYCLSKTPTNCLNPGFSMV